MKLSVFLPFFFGVCLTQAQPQTPVSPFSLPDGAEKWGLVWSDEFDGTEAQLDRLPAAGGARQASADGGAAIASLAAPSARRQMEPRSRPEQRT